MGHSPLQRTFLFLHVMHAMLALAPTLTLCFFGGSTPSASSSPLESEQRFFADEVDPCGECRGREGGGRDWDVEACGRAALGGMGTGVGRGTGEGGGEMDRERSDERTSFYFSALVSIRRRDEVT